MEIAEASTTTGQQQQDRPGGRRRRHQPIGLKMKRVDLDDMTRIDEALTADDYHIGPHILALYFQHSDSEWMILLNDQDQVVAFKSAHMMAADGRINMGFMLHIRDDYRGAGLGHLFGIRPSGTPHVGNNVASSIERVPHHVLSHKLLGFFGPLNVRLATFSDDDSSSGLTIQSLDQRPSVVVDALIDYDRCRVLDVDRKQFVLNWTKSSDCPATFARTLVAERNGRVVGYGTLRRFSYYYALMPLYADDPDIALRLFGRCLELVPLGESVYVYFPAVNKLTMRLVHQLYWECSDAETRLYDVTTADFDDRIHYDRIYAMHEYWPA